MSDDDIKPGEKTQRYSASTLQEGASESDKTACLKIVSGSKLGQMFPLDTEDDIVLGRSEGVDLTLTKKDVSRKHASIQFDGNNFVLRDLNSANGTHVNGEKIQEPERLSDGDKVMIGDATILQFSYLDDIKKDFQNQLLETALQDELTRAYNKSYFLNQLQTEFSFAARHRTDLAVILFDIDHFEEINDEYSYQTGDRILIELVELLRQQTRDEDILARYGGGEFIIAAREIPPQDGVTMASRLRKKIANHTFESTDGDEIHITVSIGVAAFPAIDVDSPEELIREADQALYAAKNLGRNRITLRNGES